MKRKYQSSATIKKDDGDGNIRSLHICNILDSLHEIKYHLIDTGMRYVDNDQDEKLNDDQTSEQKYFN